MAVDAVSRHQIDVYRVLVEASPRWLSSKEVAALADVSPRTARAHILKMVKLGVVEAVPAFPGYQYRTAVPVDAVGRRYVDRLRLAAETLRIDLENV